MNKATAVFVRSLAIFTLLLVRPVSARPEEPFLVGVAGPSVNLVYAFLAQDAGFFRKYGLDARVVLFDAGSILAQAALSGEVNIAVSSGVVTVASRSQGADTIIVAGLVNRLPYSVVAAKGITKWAQLKGKRIAISRFGSGTDTAVRLVLKKFGLDPAKDVIVLQVGTQPARYQALVAGVIDATLLSPPLDVDAGRQGFRILVNMAKLGIPYPQQVIETTERFARENPQTVKSFMKGFIEAVHYATTHKEETKRIMTKYLKVTDAEILEATYQSYLEVTDRGAYPNMVGMRHAIDEVAQRVPEVKSKKPADFINARFLKELEKEGFFRQLYKTK